MGKWRNGRRAGLKNQCRKVCGFESHLAHNVKYVLELVDNQCRLKSNGVATNVAVQVRILPYLQTISRIVHSEVANQNSSSIV